MQTSKSPIADSFGVEILPTDRLRIMAWGWQVRQMDCGVEGEFIGVSRVNIVLRDHRGDTYRARPSQVGVLRRDGVSGYEGNRQRGEHAESAAGRG